MSKSEAKVYLAALLVLSASMAPCSRFVTGGAAFAKNAQKNTTDPANKNTKLGKQLYEKKQYDLAIDALLQATYFARNGYAPEAFYYLGMCHKAKGDDRKALVALNKHIEQAVDEAGWGHVAIIEVLTNLKEFKEAEPHCAYALRSARPDTPLFQAAKFAHAKLCEARGDTSAACSLYRDALGSDHWKYFDAWIGFGECLMKMKNWSEAHKYISQILTSKETIKDLDYPRVHLDLGICLLAKGNHQGAIDHWHQCLEYDPENKEAHLQLAMLLDSENHISSAIKEYRNFVRLNDSPKQQLKPDGRAQQVESRIAILEQKLATDVPAARASTSPYALMQEKKAEIDKQRQMQEEQQRLQEEQLKTLPKDAGF
jgi:tetratricopeptide (TPR) repeat protein